MKKQIACLMVFLAVLAAPVHAAEINVVKVTVIKIVAEDLFSPTLEIQLSWRPAGWIADDIPMQKGESVHPKGMQPTMAGRIPLPDGLSYYLRPDLKSGMTRDDLKKIVPTRELKGDME